MDNSSEIIKEFGNSLTADIKKAIPKGTGATADSVNIEYTKDKKGNITGFIIRGGAQIGAIIDGRKPTKAGAKKGNPTVQQSVLAWIKAKGIRPKEASMNEVSLSWAISKSIHKKGYRGKGNIFADVITKSRIDSLTKTLIKSKTLAIQSDVIKEIKFV
jgi:hypothetical protein